MDFKIELWLGGALFHTTEVRIPDHDSSMSFEDNVKYREALVNAAQFKVRKEFKYEIENNKGVPQMCLVFPSKIELQIDDYESDNGEDERQDEDPSDGIDRDSQ